MIIQKLTNINNTTKYKTYRSQYADTNNHNNKNTNTYKSLISFKGDYSDDFYSLLYENINTYIHNTLKHHRRELYVGSFIEALSTSKGKQYLKLNRRMPISAIINDLYSSISPHNFKYINDLFLASGIDNGNSLERFLNTYYSQQDTSKIFANQEIEAVQIYGSLENKDDLSRYSELLLYLHNLNNSTPDCSKVNTVDILDFLKKVNVRDFKDFDSKFANYKSYFNDFYTLSDKFEAIVYLRHSYNNKINLLKDVISSANDDKTKLAEKIYTNQGELIDYLYETNDGKSLEPFSLIIGTVSNENKIKSSMKNSLAPYFNFFETPKDKINFHLFLHEYKADISDLNELSASPIIQDYEKILSIVNKTQIVNKLSSISGQDLKTASSTYKSFNDLLNVLFDNDKSNSEPIENFLALAKRFNLKDSQAVLMLYNKICKTSKKKLTPEEFIEFNQLMSLSPSGDIFKRAKSLNVTVLNLLKNERALYLKVKNNIEEYLTFDSTNFFTGKSSLQIYKEYKDLLNSTNNVASVLQNISTFAIGKDSSSAQKNLRIESLQQYFPNRKTFIDFITKNDIRFDLTPEDEIKINNYLKLFMLAQKYDQIEYFTTTGFLNNSHDDLVDFFNVCQPNCALEEVFSTIVSRNIDSFASVNELIAKYSSPEGNFDKILDSLNNLPKTVEFKSFIGTLDYLQNKLKRCNIPVTLDNENIPKINPNLFIEDNIPSTADLTELSADLLNVEHGCNFIHGLQNSLQEKEVQYSKFQIANELVGVAGKDREPYKNFNRILGLNKRNLGLDPNCSHYIYINSVRNILPQDLVDFINSDSWLPKFKGRIPNLTLHARLRLIDRFALSECSSLEELYANKIKDKLKSVLLSVYSDTPIKLRGSSDNGRIIINTKQGNTIIESVFAQNGKMITIVPQTKH